MGISRKDNYLKSNIINNMIVIPGYSIFVLFFVVNTVIINY